MLCTFTSLEELKAFSSENARLHDDAIVFQASSAEEGSFIGLLLSHSNVSAVHEERTVEDLKEKFPSVDTALVDAVWKGQQSWGACFDILNSLRCSTKSKTLLLEDSSFLQDAISWPELSASQSVQNSTWTIDSVQSLSAALGHVGISDSLDSWEILNKPTSPHAAADAGVTEGTVANLTVDGTRRGTVRSYREALLKSPSKEQSSAAAAAAELSAEMARKKVAQWKTTTNARVAPLQVHPSRVIA